MALPKLVATSPVMVDIAENGKTVALDLVSFEAKDNMVVSFNDQDIELAYVPDRKMYIGYAPGRGDGTYMLQAINPSWKLPD